MVIVSPDRAVQSVALSFQGRFVAIVGPSGAGKDSLIGAARAHFGEDGPVRFARRCITRPADAGGEDHIAVTSSEFATAQAQGEFCLAWEAHGLSYGIPAGELVNFGRGKTVVANVSRGVIPEVRRLFTARKIVLVTAPPEVLSRRLSARGRETAEEVAARHARPAPMVPTGSDVVTIVNDGTLGEAATALINVLS